MASSEPKIVVYQAVNRNNGKRYIGVTSRGIEARKRGHKSAVARGSKGHFYAAIRKYGFDVFEFSILEECVTYDMALERERALIGEFSPEYNIVAGGRGPSGYKHTPEALEKMAKNRLGTIGFWRGKKRPDIGKKNSIRLLANPLKYWLGKKRSFETIEKIRKAKTGVPRKPAPPHALAIHINNMRRAALNRRKPVRCLFDMKEFMSAEDAAKYYGFSKVAVSQVCTSKKRSAVYGLKFEYIEGSSS